MLSSRNEYYQIICYFQKLIFKTDMITLQIFNRFSKVSETLQEARLILVFPSRSYFLFLFLFWCVCLVGWGGGGGGHF
jgi:Na+-transporting NADH:ubiquinone oxidoreductase subunit NqrD